MTTPDVDGTKDGERLERPDVDGSKDGMRLNDPYGTTVFMCRKE